MMSGDDAIGALGIAMTGERDFSDAEVADLLEAGKVLAGFAK
jgi:hypothetical protein